jgi:rhodanese-related sulfurtransferase
VDRSSGLWQLEVVRCPPGLASGELIPVELLKPMKTITATELARLHAANPGLELLDVRTPAEFGEVHLSFATNVPLDRLNPRELVSARKGGEAPVYVICRSGKRGAMACERIAAAGLDEVYNVEGGTEAAIAAGLPAVRGRKAMSLERQVRIVAGILVLAGAGLGWQLHPAWYGLSALVGAGLVFAGVTDTCAMGMLLAKMPWNQRSTACRGG